MIIVAPLHLLKVEELHGLLVDEAMTIETASELTISLKLAST